MSSVSAGRRSRRCGPGAAVSSSSPATPASARAGCSTSCASSRRATGAAGSRAAASPTASRCRTGRSATCCAASGSGPEPTSPSYAFASACAAGSSSSSAARQTSSIRTSAACSRSRSSTRRRRAPSQLSPEALQWRTFEVVGQLFARLAEYAPLVLAFEDLHWADPTSVLLLEQLLSLAEDAPVLLVLSLRPGAGPPRVEPARARRPRVPAPAPRDRPRPARRTQTASCSRPSSRRRHCRPSSSGASSRRPTGIRSSSRSSSARSPTSARSSAIDEGWRFDHAVEVEVPPTVEKAILARLDRLSAPARELVTAASALGRTFALPLLEGVARRGPRDALHELQRLGLLRQSRRWPQPEYRFRHALIQETAYRTLLAEQRTSLHRRAAEWLEERYAERDVEVLGLLAYHWLRAEDEEKAAGLPPARRRQGAARVRARRGDRALPRPAAAARAARRAPGDRARPLQARTRAPHVAPVRRGERGVPARVRALDAA